MEEFFREMRHFAAISALNISELREWKVRDVIRLLDRIPSGLEAIAPGMDAALASILGLGVPSAARGLIFSLHLDPGPSGIEMVKEAILMLDSRERDSSHPGIWWLALSNICKERVDGHAFFLQIELVRVIARDPKVRADEARKMVGKLRGTVDRSLGYPMGTNDWCLWGAYLQGEKWAAMDATGIYGVYFLSTYMDSLGLGTPESPTFEFAPGVDSEGRTTSGLITRKLAKFGSVEELERAIVVVRKTL